jgi:hypothetical protein
MNHELQVGYAELLGDTQRLCLGARPGASPNPMALKIAKMRIMQFLPQPDYVPL